MHTAPDDEIYLGSPDNPKTAAVVCYITFLGWLIAYALYRNNKTSFAASHLRQTLLLYIILVLVNGLGYWANREFVIVADIIWFVLWLWGFFYAVNEREKPIPIVGNMASVLFSGL